MVIKLPVKKTSDTGITTSPRLTTS